MGQPSSKVAELANSGKYSSMHQNPRGGAPYGSSYVDLGFTPRLGAHGSRAGGYDPAMGQTRKRKSQRILTVTFIEP
ncbi:hypothetical protein BQ8482_480123 [Mesorhizobium delmotii]|uniref:Uncharacterized protein n=1 Tax=Mesorhizobium delmotii TaxID=1631247 RepID=A0A2P9AU16_9HYPH|nr:hypothetical protein BQ8482_480123 [Mesorhizobium delmotii]